MIFITKGTFFKRPPLLRAKSDRKLGIKMNERKVIKFERLRRAAFLDDDELMKIFMFSLLDDYYLMLDSCGKY